MADDPELVFSGFPEVALDAGAARGVSVVRTAVLPAEPVAAYVGLAREVAARGWILDATLGRDEPRDYAAWASAVARRLAATGVRLRLGVLNEPDLALDAPDACDAVTEQRVLHELGYRTERRAYWARQKIRRWRWVRVGRREHARRAKGRHHAPRGNHRRRVRRVRRLVV